MLDRSRLAEAKEVGTVRHID